MRALSGASCESVRPDDVVIRLCFIGETFGGILYRQKKTAEWKDQLLFESLMAKLSAQLVSLPVEQTDSLIQEFLGLLCESFGVDRCVIWQRTLDSPESVLLTHIFQPVEAPPFERLMDPDILPDHDRIHLSRKESTPRIRINLATLFPWAFRQLERRETIVIPSLDDLPEEAAIDKSSFRAYATKSNVTVPLLVGHQWLGILTFASILEERNWTKQEVKRFQIVGDLLINALVRQRTYQELRRSENRYRCLFETVSDAIFLVDPSTGRIVDANPAAESMYGYGRDELRQLSMSDLSAEPEKTIQSIAMRDEHVPLRWHRRRNGTPFPVEILVSDFAGQDPHGVVAAIRDVAERVRTEETLRQSEKDLRTLAGRLIYAQEDERRRLARELHDDLSQRLAMLAIDAEDLQQGLGAYPEPLQKQLRNIQDQVVEIAKDVHDLSRRLHPSILETLGLANAIRSECRSFTQREGITAHFDAQPIPAHIRKEVTLCIYRIVQEGLRNIAKHARAKEAHVSLSAEGDAICLSIRDDGIGFDPGLSRGRGGLGLASMDERVRLIQGSVTINSKPGAGTAITVRIPSEARSNLEVLPTSGP